MQYKKQINIEFRRQDSVDLLHTHLEKDGTAYKCKQGKGLNYD